MLSIPTRAAVEEGIVPGGGVALVRCLGVLAQLKEATEGEERLGDSKVIIRAIEEPLRQVQTMQA